MSDQQEVVRENFPLDTVEHRALRAYWGSCLRDEIIAAIEREIRDAVAREREACAELLELDAGMSSYVKLAAEIRERKTP